MGLGKWMTSLTRSDPTRDWPAGTVSALEFDEASGRLNGIALDAPISAAMALGPADAASGGRDDADLDYHTLGLQVGCFEGVVVHFRVIVDPVTRASAGERAFQPGELTLRTGGRTLRLTRQTTEQDLIAQLGPPVETGPVVGDRVHTFLLERSMIDTYHDTASGRLLELTVCLKADDLAECGGGC
jgi:hypothetical protein